MATIVTAYFKLEKSKSSHDIYLEWMQNMLLINNPMVIFCDSDCEHYIRTCRKLNDPTLEKTHIVLTNFQEFYTYRYLKTFQENYEKDTEQQVGHNEFLYMIWNEKSNFLKRAIELDPFKTDYFLWVDIGCFRKTNVEFIDWPNPEKINRLPKNKVLLLSVYPFTPEELSCNSKELLPSFQFTNRIGATIFGGGKDILLKWHTLYYDMLEYFISIDRFIGKDQSIMNSIFLLNQEHCQLISWKDNLHLVTWIPHYHDIWFFFQNYLK